MKKTMFIVIMFVAALCTASVGLAKQKYQVPSSFHTSQIEHYENFGEVYSVDTPDMLVQFETNSQHSLVRVALVVDDHTVVDWSRPSEKAAWKKSASADGDIDPARWTRFFEKKVQTSPAAYTLLDTWYETSGPVIEHSHMSLPVRHVGGSEWTKVGVQEFAGVPPTQTKFHLKKVDGKFFPLTEKGSSHVCYEVLSVMTSSSDGSCYITIFPSKGPEIFSDIGVSNFTTPPTKGTKFYVVVTPDGKLDPIPALD